MSRGATESRRTMDETNLNLGEKLNNWLSSLSLERRATVLSVHDADFMSNLLKLWSLSSPSPLRPNFIGGVGVDGKKETGEAEERKVQNPVDWSMEFLLNDIENTFMEKRKKYHSPLDFSLQEFGVSSAPIDSNVKKADEGEGGIMYESLTTKGSDYNVELDSAEACGEERIRWDKNTSRIVGKGKREASYGENDKFVEDSGEIGSTVNTNQLDASLLENITVVFPVVMRLHLDFSTLYTAGFTISDGISSPILSLHPSSYQKLKLINLSSGDSRVPTTWTAILRQHAENSSDYRESPTVSLLAIIISRIHFAATEAYFTESKEVDLLSTEDIQKTKEEQYSLEQYATSQEENGETKNDSHCTTVSCCAKVSVFDKQPCKQNSILNTNQTENTKTQNNIAGPLPYLYQLSDIFEKYSSSVHCDLGDIRSIFGEDFEVNKLPFVSLKLFLQVDESSIVKVDAILKKILDAVVKKAIQEGYFSDSKISSKKYANEKHNLKGDGKKRNKDTASFKSIQNVQQTTTGKKKKKKKKRKRKSSNSEVSQGKATNTLVAKTEQLSLKEDNEDTKNASVVLATQSTKKKETVNHSTVDNIPLLPVVNSFDTDRTGISLKVSSANIDFRKSTQKTQGKLGSGILVSRLDGIGPKCVVVPESQSNSENKDKTTKVSAPDDCGADDDQWETVEVKVRGKNRQKFNDSRAQGMNIAQNGQSNTANGRKVKTGRTSVSRRRNAHRKMAREILSSVLDSVELEVRRRKKPEVRVQEERKKVSRPEQQGAPVTQQSKVVRGKPIFMRDMVLRKPVIVSKKLSGGHPPSIPQSKAKTSIARTSAQRNAHSESTKNEKKTKSSQTVATVADQSTAQTLPETLSGASGASNTQVSFTTEEVDNVSEKNISPETGAVVIDDTRSIVEVCEQKQNSVKIAVTTDTDSSPSPPLSTLLGPGNSNSASSSVASSLEAPHSSNHRHLSSCGNENDVGYHLLDVCDRLSRDMNVFMTRRALALTARRRERGALLVALQDTVSNIWSGHGNVELYGSCATQLDLPSSDVDAVILGLDPCPEVLLESTSSCKSLPSLPIKNNQGDSISDFDHSASLLESQGCNIFNRNQSILRSAYGRPTSNGERVLILAAELERQPWAVQVKAIPTASVPVVKILADPSKIPGAVSSFGSGGDWMMQQHHMAAQAAAQAAGITPPLPPSQPGQIGFSPNATPPQQGEPSFPSHTPPPWRGSDVMNGLFKVDITFEGPEHGGIGSTVFAADVIQDACNESGLHAEGTPIAQVVMVLKELLAQRRLNEPFSGGLSSYALLLLVVAVVKERSIIREEMERMEHHREFVAAEDNGIATKKLEADGSKCQRNIDNSLNSNETRDIIEPSAIIKSTSKPPQHQQFSIEESTSRKVTKDTKTEKAKEAKICNRGTEVTSKNLPTKNLKNDGTNSRSSWASIAKKNSKGTSERLNTAQPQPTKSLEIKNQKRRQTPKVTSFAEAVSRKQETKNQVPRKREEGKKAVTHSESSRCVSKPETNSAFISERIQNVPPTKPKTDPRCSSNKIPNRSIGQPLHVGGYSSKAKQITRNDESCGVDQTQHIKPNKSTLSDTKKLTRAPSLFPQGSNDVLEVLCSGETTAGKLLMHFLLYYGEHFDSRTVAIDVIGSCNPDYSNGRYTSSTPKSPFMTRRSGGTIDPVTGMLTVDPIVVYDPWEGGRGSNVARSCYAWNSIRWHFGQCYMTLSSAIERSGTSPPTASMMAESAQKDTPATLLAISSSAEYNTNRNNRKKNSSTNKNCKKSSSLGLQPPIDMVSPLLELLLSF